MIDIKRIKEVEKWLAKECIDDIEILISDCTGVGRGKIMPCHRFIDGMKTNDLKLSESILGVRVDGEFCFNEYMDYAEKDMILIPQLGTLCRVPWLARATASVICHGVYEDNKPVPFAPRQVLQHILDLYDAKGWRAVVAPEFEFYLVERQDDANDDIRPPKGKSGMRSTGADTYSVDGLHEFDDFFNEVSECCKVQNIAVDTIIHEAGPSQFELNVNHGDPMAMADESVYLKRILHQVAIKHGMYATFMAKPYPESYGSAMHLHQSVVSAVSGKNIFANSDGSDSDLLLNHIAGLQKYIPTMMPLFAPFVNSYGRFGSKLSSPTNLEWAQENRSAGLRVPSSGASARRVENRIAGSDTNPYLLIAASLAAGYLGMIEKLEASEPIEGSAYDNKGRVLPDNLLTSVNNMEECKALENVFSKEFLTTFAQIKREEHEHYTNFSGPWETQYLLLTV